MDFLGNITFRRTRTISEPKNESNEIISQTLNNTTNSMPGMSEDEEDTQINTLKAEIENLRSQLKSAHLEIEMLSLENSSLKQSNADLLKKNDMYKKVTSSPIKKRVQTPKRNKISLTNKVTSKSQTLESSDCRTSTAEDPIENSVSSLPIVKSNLCIISSETSNRLYTICQRTRFSNCNMCHYRMPNCSLKQLLHSLDKKVQNFTYSDYCVIYVGEEDFKKTQNYLELVTFIRNKIQPLTHTNFIVCLPTFKYMENKNVMFNSRVDTFNNLMFMDVETYNYAYLLDSNLNLPYTYDTYNQRYGSLNNKGLNIVITDLQDLVLDLNSANASSDAGCPQINNEPTETQLQENSQFFL